MLDAINHPSRFFRFQTFGSFAPFDLVFLDGACRAVLRAYGEPLRNLLPRFRHAHVRSFVIFSEVGRDNIADQYSLFFCCPGERVVWRFREPRAQATHTDLALSS